MLTETQKVNFKKLKNTYPFKSNTMQKFPLNCIESTWNFFTIKLMELNSDILIKPFVVHNKY